MNKATLVDVLKKEADITKADAEKVVNIFFNEISKALARGHRAEIRGFCSFFVKNYRGYMGRNPKTGESVEVKSKKLPFFKCGRELKKRVDYQ
ncbi:MAG: HU family DNA-binding protein [Candidatus Hodarchaeota archaeon]